MGKSGVVRRSKLDGNDYLPLPAESSWSVCVGVIDDDLGFAALVEETGETIEGCSTAPGTGDPVGSCCHHVGCGNSNGRFLD